MAILTDAQRAAGWKIVKLGDIAEIVMGTSPKGETVVDYPAGFPLLNGPSEFTDKYPQPVKWTEAGIRRYIILCSSNTWKNELFRPSICDWSRACCNTW